MASEIARPDKIKIANYLLYLGLMEKGFSFSTSMHEISQAYPVDLVAESGSVNGQREAGMQAKYLSSFVENTVNISTH